MEVEIKSWGPKLIKIKAKPIDYIDVAKYIINYFAGKGMYTKELWKTVGKVTSSKVEFEMEDSPTVWDFLKLELSIAGEVNANGEITVLIQKFSIKFVCDDSDETKKAQCKRIFLLGDRGYLGWTDYIKFAYNVLHRFPFELSKYVNSIWSEREEIYDFTKFFDKLPEKKVPIDFK